MADLKALQKELAWWKCQEAAKSFELAIAIEALENISTLACEYSLKQTEIAREALKQIKR